MKVSGKKPDSQNCANGSGVATQFARLSSQSRAVACANEISGVTGQAFLYRVVWQMPAPGKTPALFPVSSRNDRVREDSPSAVRPKIHLADQQAEISASERPIMKIHAGNLHAGTSDIGLAEMLEAFGIIMSAHVMTPEFFGRPRGLCFVGMTRESGALAVSKLNGQIAGGMVLRRNEVKAIL